MKDGYILAFSKEPDGLEKEVNEKIADGYTPIGGLIILSGDRFTYFFQAMILEVGKSANGERDE